MVRMATNIQSLVFLCWGGVCVGTFVLMQVIEVEQEEGQEVHHSDGFVYHHGMRLFPRVEDVRSKGEGDAAEQYHDGTQEGRKAVATHIVAHGEQHGIQYDGGGKEKEQKIVCHLIRRKGQQLIGDVLPIQHGANESVEDNQEERQHESGDIADADERHDEMIGAEGLHVCFIV